LNFNRKQWIDWAGDISIDDIRRQSMPNLSALSTTIKSILDKQRNPKDKSSNAAVGANKQTILIQVNGKHFATTKLQTDNNNNNNDNDESVMIENALTLTSVRNAVARFANTTPDNVSSSSITRIVTMTIPSNRTILNLIIENEADADADADADAK
jgi:hypothetical protein